MFCAPVRPAAAAATQQLNQFRAIVTTCLHSRARCDNARKKPVTTSLMGILSCTAFLPTQQQCMRMCMVILVRPDKLKSQGYIFAVLEHCAELPLCCVVLCLNAAAPPTCRQWLLAAHTSMA